MDFFQTVNTSLEPTQSWAVAGQLVAVLLLATMVGISLLNAPAFLVRNSTPHPQRSQPKKTVAAPPRPQGTAKKATPDIVAAHAAKPPVVAEPAPVKRSFELPKKAVASAAAPAAGGPQLEDLLDDFFEKDKLLDEALFDVTASAPAPAANLTAPTSGASRSPAPAASKVSPTSIDNELAKKMSKGLRLPSSPSASASAATARASDNDLETLLDDFMADEVMLEEAMLDSVVSQSKSQGGTAPA